MAVSTEIDLEAAQGATFRQTILAQNPDLTAYDLTGCTASMSIKSKYTDTATVVPALTSSNGGLALGGVTGYVSIYISAASTLLIKVPALTGLPPTTVYVYDINIVIPSGDTKRLCYGKFTVDSTVNK